MRAGHGKQSWLSDLICGGLIGAGAILPGVSGGVLAVAFGLYQPLMELLTEPRSALRRHGRRLIPVGIGAGGGFFAAAHGLAAVFKISATAAVWAFVGLILGTLPMLFAEAGARGRSRVGWWSMILCGGMMFAGLYIVGHTAGIQVTPNFGWYSFCGVLLGIGMIIPGMTASAILMVLGLYEPILQALTMLDWQALLACGPSLVLTVLLLARLVRWLFARYYTAAYHGIIGVVLASTGMIIPVEYNGAGEIFCAVVCCIGGFCLAFWMGKLDRRRA